jgi:hypothetical protein
MKKYILSAIVLLLIYADAFSQGCVAIRSTGGSCMMEHPAGEDSTASKWMFSANSRYFKSFRHFKGKEEQKERLRIGNEVINHTSSLDLSLTRVLNNRWSLMINIPVISNSRSSLYEHGFVNGVNNFNQRHSMHSFGLGDIRVATYRWLFDPSKFHKANAQLGLGIKLPTGDYDYKDYWYNVGPGGTKELRTVDQSIQLGDGGTGFTAELNVFYNVIQNLGVYGNFYYLINPREQNGVQTYRETIRASLANESIMSVPDQYMVRTGINYSINAVKGLVVAAGVRLEGIPVEDLVGGSGGFRRPGYIWSVEPALNYQRHKTNLFVSVPVAFDRNRTQSVTDKETTKATGTFTQGDAAFADYSVNLGLAFKF